MREVQAIGLPRRHRQHVHLHLATGVLILLQQVQTGLQFAVGGFQLVAVPLVFQTQVGAVQRTTHGVFKHGEIRQRLNQIIRGT